MGAAIKYLVPYEVKIFGGDLTTNKRIGNTFYLQSNLQSVGTPAYGAPIAGFGDTDTLLANFKTAWNTVMTACLSEKYTVFEYQLRTMLGRGYQTPSIGIGALITGALVTSIQTATPHGLTSGEAVFISGVTTPPEANGFHLVNVITSTLFTIPVTTTGVWSTNGVVQSAVGDIKFIYGDLTILADTAVGGKAGDALPIFSDVSVRRINPGTGKNWRSRVGVAIVSEADNDYGALKTSALATWTTTFNTFATTPILNGGTDATSSQMGPVVVSKALAMTVTNPFISAAGWVQTCTDMVPHQRLGSQIQRKPPINM